MNTDLLKMKTEILNAAAEELIALETEVARIIEQYKGINLNSIVAMFHRFNNTQIEVNGDTFLEGRLCYADTVTFPWNGDPATLEYMRIGDYGKHLAYIYIYPKDDAHKGYIRRFDIGYEDDADYAEDVSPEDLTEELKKRENTVPENVKDTATRMFNELQEYLKKNNFSLCYDEDDASVFIGPKNLKWNVGEGGYIPFNRKFMTHDLMERFAEQGHIATECITHVHTSDSDDTFHNCNLTYEV